MPTVKKYALFDGGPKDLEISRTRFTWRNLTIRFAGETVLTVPTKKELQDYRTVTLPTGQELSIVLNSNFHETYLDLTLDGEPVPGSHGDPRSRLKLAYVDIFLLAGSNALFGLAAKYPDIGFLHRFGSDSGLVVSNLGWGPIVSAVIFGVLGLLVMGRSRIALLTTMALLVVDTLVIVSVALDYGEPDPTVPMLVRGILLVGISRAFSAIEELKEGPSPLQPPNEGELDQAQGS